jgi:hypothetical protein
MSSIDAEILLFLRGIVSFDEKQLLALGLMRDLEELPFGKGCGIARYMGKHRIEPDCMGNLIAYLRLFPSDLAVTETGIQKRSKPTPTKRKLDPCLLLFHSLEIAS